MISSLNTETCPFYEKHAGEYYQGCWEFSDCCYLSMDVDSFNSHCYKNTEICPLHYKLRKEANGRK